VIDISHVSLGILAGGRGSRLGGADKALLEYRGYSLLTRTLHAFPEAFSERLLSYNREPGEVVSDLGLRVVPDLRPDQPGPLAALEALFWACRTPWLLTVPVDIRDWPPGLSAEFRELTEEGRGGCVLADADGLQPLVGLWCPPVLRGSVSAALDSGERAVHRWVAMSGLSTHDIAPWCLGNLNSLADFHPH
jgi:molybdopterin-guanine dinucleotide biosynthesis protein A